MRVALVGCVKEKQPIAAPAADLYISALFRGRRRFVERSCDRWYILSALHGVVDPADLIDPYDKTLKNAGRAERRRWSTTVLEDLDRRVRGLGAHTFEIHPGADYFAWGLYDGLIGAGAVVEIPTRGLRVGEQLAFYKERR